MAWPPGELPDQLLDRLEVESVGRAVTPVVRQCSGMYLESRLVPGYERSVSASAPQGQDGIARKPCDQEGSLHRDWPERREDEHQQVESHQRSGGDYPSTVSQDDQSTPRQCHHRMNRWRRGVASD